MESNLHIYSTRSQCVGIVHVTYFRNRPQFHEKFETVDPVIIQEQCSDIMMGAMVS